MKITDTSDLDSLCAWSPPVNRNNFFQFDLSTNINKTKKLSKNVRGEIDLHNDRMGYETISKKIGVKMATIGVIIWKWKNKM